MKKTNVLFLAGCLLFCFTNNAFAQPTVSVSNLGANSDGNLEWLVEVTPDTSLFITGEGSLAAELGFEFSGSTLASTTVNEDVWAFENPGFNPFTNTITVGATTTESQAFLALGSGPISETVELATFTTVGTDDTTVSWGGYDIRPGLPGGFTGGLVAQAGQKFEAITGSMSSGGGTVVDPADCNGDAIVDAADLLCACATGSIDDVLAATGLLPGDLDGDGSVAFADFLAMSANFGQAGDYTGGDVDCNGQVAFADFLVLSANFGQTSAAAAPEPNSFVLALLSVIGLQLVRQRRRRTR